MKANTLVKFWSRANLSQKPFAHADDREHLEAIGDDVCWEVKDITKFLSSDRARAVADNKIDLSLFPKPYAGNLNKADIVVLLTNPGLSYGDYFAESNCRTFNRRLRATLAQEFAGVDFPFLWLDPSFCWHPGFVWWEEKLRGVIREFAKKKQLSYLEALKHVSQRLACIEMVPYHSRSFHSDRLATYLPSARAARSYAQDVLEPSAKAKKKTVIVTRREKEWGLRSRSKNLVRYSGGQARSASLGVVTPGGAKILETLLR